VTRTANSEIGLEPASSSGKREVMAFAVLAEDEKDFPIYWIKFDPTVTKEDQLISCLNDVLVDPVYQTGTLLKSENLQKLFSTFKTRGFRWIAKKQFLPGVTDNLAHTIAEALRIKGIAPHIGVASGSGHLLAGEGLADVKAVQSTSQYHLYHPLVEKLFVVDMNAAAEDAVLPGFPDVLLSQPKPPDTIQLTGLDDKQLMQMSKERLLALSLEEMKAIRDYFASKDVIATRTKQGLPESPTDVELEVLAQTWSEHCKHKIFNATINYVEKKSADDSSGKSEKIQSLYKTYIKGATKKLSAQRPDLLSVFEDNSGVVKWNEEVAVCFKVETHNSPSALEPYGGALTGILGVNRDILGTGLGAKPIFNTDIFCFAHPDSELADRPKLLPPDAIPTGVRKGVQDGGNKSGIPTVNGSLFFHDGYRAKPLVFCGTGGILPIKRDGINLYEKHTKPGDRIIMVGGRVGKDGIHGATFSSESMHEGSPVTAVQIGDPFTQKRVIDFVLAARDNGLITGLTDNGAGGLSSSVGEMATITGGASVDLAKVPLKYPGLEDWQIIVSESQERMTLSTSQVAELKELAEAYNVEVSDIGEFHDKGYFEILRDDKTVALISLEFLHDGVPKLDLPAEWYPNATGSKTNADVDGTSKVPSATGTSNALKQAGSGLTTKTLLAQAAKAKEEISKGNTSFNDHLSALLSHPNIASKEFLIRQYDHEVQGGSVIKPLMGLEQTAPCDAAVIKPVYGQPEGLVVSNGMCPQYSEHDPYLMAVSAVDEAVRNAVAVGVDPATICLLDNFCWPDPVNSERNPEGAFKLGQLVRTCQGLYDICIAYGAPLISGKDSMKNDFDDGVIRLSIPPTLLVSAIGKLPDSLKSVTMQFKHAGDVLYLLSAGTTSLLGSHFAALFDSTSSKTSPGSSDKETSSPESTSSTSSKPIGSTKPFAASEPQLPTLNLKAAAEMYRKLFEAIQQGLINSAHDLSEGGLAVSLAECCIGSNLGAHVSLEDLVDQKNNGDVVSSLFGEGPGTILVSVSPRNIPAWEALWAPLKDVTNNHIGTVSGDSRLLVSSDAGETATIEMAIDQLKSAWLAPLPFE
jgi:phosphoribosylformylglycinamidine synthase subunit PurSL